MLTKQKLNEAFNAEMTDLQASINVQMGRLKVLNTEFDSATKINRDTRPIQQARIATLNLLTDLIHEQYAAVNDGKLFNLSL